jgi:hypothetical protein
VEIATTKFEANLLENIQETLHHIYELTQLKAGTRENEPVTEHNLESGR